MRVGEGSKNREQQEKDREQKNPCRYQKSCWGGSTRNCGRIRSIKRKKQIFSHSENQIHRFWFILWCSFEVEVLVTKISRSYRSILRLFFWNLPLPFRFSRKDLASQIHALVFIGTSTVASCPQVTLRGVMDRFTGERYLSYFVSDPVWTGKGSRCLRRGSLSSRGSLSRGFLSKTFVFHGRI